MSSGVYNRCKANLMNKEVDLEADTVKIALLDDNHSFDETDNELSDVDSNELDDGDGYSTGGETIENLSVTQNDTDNRADWDGDDVEWTDATFTAYHGVLYDDDLTDDDLICSFDFGGGQEVQDGTFKVEFSDDGIIILE